MYFKGKYSSHLDAWPADDILIAGEAKDHTDAKNTVITCCLSFNAAEWGTSNEI